MASIVASTASAGLAQTQMYQLLNHPDGSQAPPPYGLRLDELFDITAQQDRFTFDFEHSEAAMKLTYDGASIVIEGTAFGGRQIGGDYAAELTTGLYEIFFVYEVGVGSVPGDDDLQVVADGENSGSIQLIQSAFPSKQPLPDAIQLVDKSDGARSFRFGDEDDDAGHRGFAGLSGWGWLTHGPDPDNHISASDWLFTAIPTPGSLTLLGLGFLTLGRRHR